MDPTTTIAGTQYATKLLRGREARTVGLIVTAAALRGIGAAMAKADLEKVVKQIPEIGGGDTPPLKVLDTLSWAEIASAVGGLADGGATMLDMIGPDGLEVITKAFTDQTRVWVPADHPGSTQTFETPLANRDDHWVGKWPHFIQWLWWEVKVNGFFPDLSGLAARSKSRNGSDGAQAAAPPPTS